MSPASYVSGPHSYDYVGSLLLLPDADCLDLQMLAMHLSFILQQTVF